MKNLLLSLGFFFSIWATAQTTIELDSTTIETTILTENLNIPWEITWGPDNYIWMTERNGLISRINPETGERIALTFLTEVLEIQETGLLGLVLHPNFEEIPQVFVVYTHYNQLADKSEKIVRFDYDADNNDLINETIIFENIPAFDNHVGSRLVISPDLKLFVTTGDANEGEKAQDLSFLNGKVLRLNLDGSIPADNPFGADNPIWSYGHRNAQGLVLAPNGKLYSSEHGPDSDDEINEIIETQNYGWENVEGFCDLEEELVYCQENEITEPLYAWTPTIAPCGLDYYQHPAIPEWQNSLMLAVLKSRDLRVMPLNEIGDSIIDGTETPYLNAEYGRFRDLCLAPDGRIFLATSNNDFYGDPITYGPDKILQLQSDVSPPPYPQANFILEVDSCGAIDLKNLSINTDSVEWVIGTDENPDIAILNTENPNYQLPFSAWYTIQLNASNDNFINTKTYRLWIETCVNLPLVESNFSVEDSCLNVSLLNQSTEATSYLWNFGNGITSESESPNLIYENEGEYLLTLIAINGTVQDTSTQLISLDDCITDGVLETPSQYEIQIVPNPVKDLMQVYTSKDFGTQSIQVFDKQGQVVFEAKNGVFENPISLKMSHLSKGVYWLVLKNKDNNTIFSNFVVE